MGVIVLGEYVRVRWRAMNSDESRLLDADKTDATAEALLSCPRVNEAWGLLPRQSVLLAGHGIAASDRGLGAVIQIGEPMGECPSLRLTVASQSLVCIESSAHCWASCGGADDIRAEDVILEWECVRVPGVDPITVGRLSIAGVAMTLKWPAPAEEKRQAGLYECDVSQLSFPFSPVDGQDDLEAGRIAYGAVRGDQALAIASGWRRSLPRYRYGVIGSTGSRWPDLAAGPTAAPDRTLTREFRNRLRQLGRRLAPKGIQYEDDENAYNYELAYAIEDADFPDTWQRRDGILARSVSSRDDLTDRVDRARARFDPGDDHEDWFYDVIDPRQEPSRQDVTGTDIIYSCGSVDGRAMSDSWIVATIVAEAQAVGLVAVVSRAGIVSVGLRQHAV